MEDLKDRPIAALNLEAMDGVQKSLEMIMAIQRVENDRLIRAGLREMTTHLQGTIERLQEIDRQSLQK